MYILCAPGDSVREFMITAYMMGLIQTGEYVFIDVELFYFPGDYWGDHGWRRGDANDTIAKKAYEALLRITLIDPKGKEYLDWSQQVKSRAEELYNFNFDQRGESVMAFSTLRSHPKLYIPKLVIDRLICRCI